MKQLVIGLDVDDVLGDLLTPWLQRYRDEMANRMTPDEALTPENLRSWDIEGQARRPELVRATLKEVDYAREVKPMPSALAAVEELRKLGRVIFVTSCPQLYSAQPKYRWLQQHGFLPGDGSGQADYFPVKDKAMIRMDVLFDDAEHNVQAVQDAGGFGVLVRRPHNRNSNWTQSVPGIYSAPTWVRDNLIG